MPQDINPHPNITLEQAQEVIQFWACVNAKTPLNEWLMHPNCQNRPWLQNTAMNVLLLAKTMKLLAPALGMEVTDDQTFSAAGAVIGGNPALEKEPPPS